MIAGTALSIFLVMLWHKNSKAKIASREQFFVVLEPQVLRATQEVVEVFLMHTGKEKCLNSELIKNYVPLLSLSRVLYFERNCENYSFNIFVMPSEIFFRLHKYIPELLSYS
jgi:hypothetical protein